MTTSRDKGEPLFPGDTLEYTNMYVTKLSEHSLFWDGQGNFEFAILMYSGTSL